MASLSDSERLLVARVRGGDADAWNELIAVFEGRLLAFVAGRIGNRAAAEDVVQETLLGFLNSLPNFDESRSLENYLFSIAAHKLTDYLRREGRRPALPLASAASSDDWNLPDRARRASSLVQSSERKGWEAAALAAAMREQLGRIQARGEWQKIKCLELLFVRGWANKEVARELALTEQIVANFKFDFLERLRALVRGQGLPEALFPQLEKGSD